LPIKAQLEGPSTDFVAYIQTNISMERWRRSFKKAAGLNNTIHSPKTVASAAIYCPTCRKSPQ